MIKLLYIPPEFSNFYNPLNLDEKDQRRIKEFPNLEQKTEWRASRVGKELCRNYFKTNNFCLTHKNEHSLFSLSNYDNGVDLEFLKTKRDILALAERVFNETELKLLQNTENKTKFFYELWTIKESLIKAENLDFPKDMKAVGIKENFELRVKNQEFKNNCLVQGSFLNNFVFSAVFLGMKTAEKIVFYSPTELNVEIKNLDFEFQLLTPNFSLLIE